MALKRFFRFAYPAKNYIAASKKEEGLLLQRLRDGDAFSELATVFCSQGYEYGGLVLNYPFPKNQPENFEEPDISCFRPSDILVLPTRPPLDDDKEYDRKIVTRSNNSLERKIFKAVRKHFEICSRPRMKLTQEIAELLPEKFSDRADIQFRQYRSAWYKSYREYKSLHPKEPAQKNLTAAYLFYNPQAWEGGPGLLAAFGMSGTETLVWAYMLRTRYRNLLELNAPKFVMAEITSHEIPAYPTTLSFLDGWDTEIILNASL